MPPEVPSPYDAAYQQVAILSNQSQPRLPGLLPERQRANELVPVQAAGDRAQQPGRPELPGAPLRREYLREVPRANDYRNPQTFDNPYGHLQQAHMLLRTRGIEYMRHAEPEYERARAAAERIDQTRVSQDRINTSMQLHTIDQWLRYGAQGGLAARDMQRLQLQRQMLVQRRESLEALYLAPATSRINHGIACIRTGIPEYIRKGEQLVQEGLRLRPEIRNDRNYQRHLQNAYTEAQQRRGWTMQRLVPLPGERIAPPGGDNRPPGGDNRPPGPNPNRPGETRPPLYSTGDGPQDAERRRQGLEAPRPSEQARQILDRLRQNLTVREGNGLDPRLLITGPGGQQLDPFSFENGNFIQRDANGQITGRVPAGSVRVTFELPRGLSADQRQQCQALLGDMLTLIVEGRPAFARLLAATELQPNNQLTGDQMRIVLRRPGAPDQEVVEVRGGRLMVRGGGGTEPIDLRDGDKLVMQVSPARFAEVGRTARPYHAVTNLLLSGDMGQPAGTGTQPGDQGNQDGSNWQRLMELAAAGLGGVAVWKLGRGVYEGYMQRAREAGFVPPRPQHDTTARFADRATVEVKEDLRGGEPRLVVRERANPRSVLDPARFRDGFFEVSDGAGGTRRVSPIDCDFVFQIPPGTDAERAASTNRLRNNLMLVLEGKGQYAELLARTTVEAREGLTRGQFNLVLRSQDGSAERGVVGVSDGKLVVRTASGTEQVQMRPDDRLVMYVSQQSLQEARTSGRADNVVTNMALQGELHRAVEPAAAPGRPAAPENTNSNLPPDRTSEGQPPAMTAEQATQRRVAIERQTEQLRTMQEGLQARLADAQQRLAALQGQPVTQQQRNDLEQYVRETRTQLEEVTRQVDHARRSLAEIEGVPGADPAAINALREQLAALETAQTQATGRLSETSSRLTHLTVGDSPAPVSPAGSGNGNGAGTGSGGGTGNGGTRTETPARPGDQPAAGDRPAPAAPDLQTILGGHGAGGTSFDVNGQSVRNVIAIYLQEQRAGHQIDPVAIARQASQLRRAILGTGGRDISAERVNQIIARYQANPLSASQIGTLSDQQLINWASGRPLDAPAAPTVAPAAPGGEQSGASPPVISQLTGEQQLNRMGGGSPSVEVSSQTGQGAVGSDRVGGTAGAMAEVAQLTPDNLKSFYDRCIQELSQRVGAETDTARRTQLETELKRLQGLSRALDPANPQRQVNFDRIVRVGEVDPARVPGASMWSGRAVRIGGVVTSLAVLVGAGLMVRDLLSGADDES